MRETTRNQIPLDMDAGAKTSSASSMFLNKADIILARFPLSSALALILVAAFIVNANFSTEYDDKSAAEGSLLSQASFLLVVSSTTSLVKFHSSGLKDLQSSAGTTIEQPIVLRILKMRHAFLTEVKYALVTILVTIIVLAVLVNVHVLVLDMDLCITVHAFLSSVVMETFARLILLPMCKMPSFDDPVFSKTRSVSVAPMPAPTLALDPSSWVYVRASCFGVHHFTCLWLGVCGLLIMILGPSMGIIALLGLILFLPAAVIEVLGFVAGKEMQTSSLLTRSEADSNKGTDRHFAEESGTVTGMNEAIKRYSAKFHRMCAIWRYAVPVLPQAQQNAFWRHQSGNGPVFKCLFVTATIPTILLCAGWVAKVIVLGFFPGSSTALFVREACSSIVPVMLLTASQAAVLLFLTTLGTIMDAVFFEAALEFTAREQNNSTALLRWLSHECRSPVAAAILATDELLDQMLPELQGLIARAETIASAQDLHVRGMSPPNATVSAPLLFQQQLALGLGQQHTPQEPVGEQVQMDSSIVCTQNTGVSSNAPRRISCMSLGASCSFDDEQVNSAAGALAIDSCSPKHKILQILQRGQLYMRTMVDAIRMVQQPVNALSGVLDNMLLYLRNQRASADLVRPLQGASTSLDLAAAWESAFRNALASSDTAGVRSKKFRFSFGSTTQATTTVEGTYVSTIKQASRLLHGIKCSSSFTQSTLVQVLTNFVTNAMKYGESQNARTNYIDINVSLIHKADASVSKEDAKHVKQAAELAKSWMLQYLSANPKSTPKGTHADSTPLSSGHSCFPSVLRLTVKDFGMGMSKAESSGLFQPFSRLRSGFTQKGTGLGLWLMRQLVESQGGSVFASSAGQGQGSTFSMFAPVLFWEKMQPHATTGLKKKKRGSVSAGDKFHESALNSEGDRLPSPYPARVRHSHTYGSVSLAIHPLQTGQVHDEASQSRARTAAVASAGSGVFKPLPRQHSSRSDQEYVYAKRTSASELTTGCTSESREFDSRAADPRAAVTISSENECNYEALLVHPFRAGPRVSAAPSIAVRIKHPAKSWHILLVDDAVSIRTMLQRQLRRAGHTVVVACNGQEGLDTWRVSCASAAAERFDAIVTDITMPQMNGDEMVAAICTEHASSSDIISRPVLIGATGNTLPQDIANYRAAGMDDVLCKPFAARDVLRSIAKCLSSPNGEA